MEILSEEGVKERVVELACEHEPVTEGALKGSARLERSALARHIAYGHEDFEAGEAES